MKVHRYTRIPKHNQVLLSADIGATTSRFGLFITKNKKPVLTQSLIFSNKEVASPTHLFNAVKEHIGKENLKISSIVAGVAAPVTSSTVVFPNNGWRFSLLEVKKIIHSPVCFINDLEAVAWAIQTIKPSQVRSLTTHKSRSRKPIKVVGAGTGLGNATLYWNDHANVYIPSSSEEGHRLLTATTTQEFNLLQHIKKKKKHPLVYQEDVLSGKGLEYLYTYFSKNKKTLSADDIASRRQKDSSAKAALDMFSRYYARFIRENILTLLPGAVYIAGGIAQKNPFILTSKPFKDEIYKHDYLRSYVQNTPLYLITDPLIGLWGAARYALR